MSIILGIDPGSRITGYGVIRQQGRHLQYLGSGCIRTSEKELPGRLKQIYASLKPMPRMHSVWQFVMPIRTRPWLRSQVKQAVREKGVIARLSPY